MKLISLVTDLADYLNSDDGPTRAKSECAVTRPCADSLTQMLQPCPISPKCSLPLRPKYCHSRSVRPPLALTSLSYTACLRPGVSERYHPVAWNMEHGT
jgi:hypothetical protein